MDQSTFEPLKSKEKTEGGRSGEKIFVEYYVSPYNKW
jgi:hypothetical protein